MKHKTAAVLKVHPERVVEIEKQSRSADAGAEPGRGGLTDLDNARRLVARHGENLRYCHGYEKWLIWEQQRWRVDDSREVERRAKETAEAIALEGADESDSKRRGEIERWAERSKAEFRIRAMINMARAESDIGSQPSELDRDPWALNCFNGTVDLRTGELRPHRRQDLCTKLVPVQYDPTAECPRWRRFLDGIMPERPGLKLFLQQIIGYCLTGDIREQAIFIFHGTGANGKTTFLETIRAAFGDYAKNATFSTFLATESNSARNDLARLVGARLVTAAEVGGGRRLSEDLIKQITGGDPITARFLYREFFEYKPQFKVILAVNHLPLIRGAEHGIWRRIHRIPFSVTIPKDQQDPTLGQKLREELPGILAWAVQGCLAWREPGLQPPQEALAATQQYREEMDMLSGFLEARCVPEPAAITPSKELYDTYTGYCAENGEKPVSQTAFGTRLCERGYQHAQIAKRRLRAWKGIRLRTDSEDKAGAEEAED